jgi:hypothetical protein
MMNMRFIMAEEAGAGKKFPYRESAMKKERMPFTMECDSPPFHALYKRCNKLRTLSYNKTPIATGGCNWRLRAIYTQQTYSHNGVWLVRRRFPQTTRRFSRVGHHHIISVIGGWFMKNMERQLARAAKDNLAAPPFTGGQGRGRTLLLQ